MRCNPSVLYSAALVMILCGTTSSSVAADEETTEQRRARLEQMSDAEKSRLLEKKRKFDDLGWEEQQKYRQLHGKLTSDPNYDHLRGIMQRYSEWLKTLTPTERAELARLPTHERLQRVKMLMEAQSQERFIHMLKDMQASQHLLSQEDQQFICRWTDQFLENHRDEILASVPESSFVDEMKSNYDARKHLHFLRFFYFRSEPYRKSGPGSDPNSRAKSDPESPGNGEAPQVSLPKPSPEDIKELIQGVSQRARDALASAENEEERLQVIHHWMRAAAFARFRPPVSPQELDRFVREGGVTAEEQEWLESLPRDRVFHELRRLYYRKRFQGGRGGGRWGGFSGGRDGKSREGGGRGGRGGASGRGPGREFRSDQDRGSAGERGRRGDDRGDPGRAGERQRQGSNEGD